MRPNKLKDPELLQFYIEGYDRSWLKKHAFKRGVSVAEVIRQLIRNLIKRALD